MNQLTEDCAAYFRNNPAWQRMFEQLRRAYQMYGRTAGTVKLPDPSPEECEAARKLFGHPFSAPLRFKAAEFEAALRTTKYAAVPLRDLLETYFDCEICTRKQERLEREGRLARVLSQARRQCGSASCRAWLDTLSERMGHGYARLQRALSEGLDAGAALSGVCGAVQALETGSAQPVRLAVLSARATSDPHALDAGTLCGELFLQFLAWRAGVANPSGAEERDELFYQWGILNDSISSTVTQVGLMLYTQEGEHPAYRAFRLRSEICTLTLTNLARLTRAKSPAGRAYLVENQMVFSQLCDCAEAFRAPLICTSGQPQIAVLRLLDLLAVSGTQMFYSGDFDGKGLSIPTQLLRRWPDHLQLWHMAPEDYEKCHSERDLSEQSARLLLHCAPCLQPTAQAILRRGKAGYQELLLPELLKDLTLAP